MCGIAGIIDKNGVRTNDLIKMSKVLQHRGPDDEGFLLINKQNESTDCKGQDSIPEIKHYQFISNYEGNPTLGVLHRRLSILDLSPAAHQPMRYGNDQLFITYNGEVYNYREIRDELKNKGYGFTSDSDTEVILAAYQEWGKNCVSRFIGMWAFAIIDLNKSIAFLSRDRFGIKPLYYIFQQNKFAFASEIKALLELPFVSRKANYNAAIEYLSYGANTNPFNCLFDHIELVEPAQNIIVDINSFTIQKEKYYSLQQQLQSKRTGKSNELKEFQDLFDDAINLHLRSDVPIGTCLSGGLDSSAIVSIVANKINGKQLKTFTTSYADKKIDETVYAKMVNNHFKNIEANYTYPDIKSYWKDFDKLIWHQDLPIHSISVYAQWEVMKLVGNKKTKVVLNGQGSDEILGGYYHFAGIHLIELLKKGQLFSFFHEFKHTKENFTPTLLNDMGRAFFYFLPKALQDTIRKEKRLGPNFISKAHKTVSESPKRAGKTFKESSIANINYGLQDLLRYEDRNSMAFSVESRVPFLDHRLVEFCIALDNEWKVKDGWSKYILRKTIENKLPQEVVWRKTKMGFVTPHGVWKKELKKELLEYINTTDLPNFIDKQYLIKTCETDLNNANHLSEFWKILSFIKWVEVFKVEF